MPADCRHDGCHGSTCRLDACQDAVDKIGGRLDAVEKRDTEHHRVTVDAAPREYRVELKAVGPYGTRYGQVTVLATSTAEAEQKALRRVHSDPLFSSASNPKTYQVTKIDPV